MIYFTSDLHHQHKRICEFTGRKDVTNHEEHTQWLIDMINTRVTNSDQLYLLGDISFSHKVNEVCDFYSKLNGQKFVIKGNHDDRKGLNALVEQGIIQAWYDYKEKTVSFEGENYHLVMMHFPLAAWHKQHYGSIHLHGHTHGSYQGDGKILDIGVDNSIKIFNEYKVFSLEDVVYFTTQRDICSKTHHQPST